MTQFNFRSLYISLLAFSLLAMTEHNPMNAQQSLRLVSAIEQDIVSVRVIGSSEKARDLRYHMVVSGGSTSSTSGRVRLSPDKPVTVATVRVRAKDEWSARLEVTGDETYSATIKSPAAN